MVETMDPQRIKWIKMLERIVKVVVKRNRGIEFNKQFLEYQDNLELIVEDIGCNNIRITTVVK